jgi:predicted nuclease with RNAse H fold
MHPLPTRFIGVDVQLQRPCAFFVLDEDLAEVESGWLGNEDIPAACRSLQELAARHHAESGRPPAVGIDAPRMLLPALRRYYWKGGQWTEKTPAEKGYGRHCEVAVKALNIGNPQWTRPLDQSPPWMRLGFALFDTLADYQHVFEAYPAASFHMLHKQPQPRVTISFAHFQPGPRDMLDACLAALTVHQFIHGLGSEVGGGDGLGTIILPVPLPVPPDHAVLHWPETEM